MAPETLTGSSRPTSRTGGTATLLVWPGVVYVVATSFGLLLRGVFVGWSTGLPFDHLLHAHSHALYFGWAGLVILAAATEVSGAGRRWAWATLALMPVMTATFLASGYAPASIAASTAVMFAWYGAIVVWWRRNPVGRRHPLRTAFAYVIVASLGVWALAVIQVTGSGDTLAAQLAIHAFLSTFAWFLVIGTAALVTARGLVDGVTSARVIRWWAATAWLLFPLGVMGGPEAGWLGPIARLAGLVVLYPTWIWVRALWKSAAQHRYQTAIRGAAISLLLAVAGLGAVSLGGSEVLAATGRQGVILYLHLLLLGYVTTMLVWWLAERFTVELRTPLLGHLGGVAAMLGGIGALALGLGWGGWAALVGATAAWLAGLFWAGLVWRSGNRVGR
jgi:hypothetical protein